MHEINQYNIENYRPKSNLSLVSKIFEKLIQKDDENNVDITSQEQHEFKKHKSTAAAGVLLQSIIANHADIREHVLWQASISAQRSTL